MVHCLIAGFCVDLGNHNRYLITEYIIFIICIMQIINLMHLTKGNLKMNLKKFKNALIDSNATEAAAILVNLYLEKPDKFKKSLLLSNSLPEPMGKSFSNEKLKTLRLAFLLAGKQLIDKNVDISKYASEFIQLSEAINIISQNSKSNEERLNENSFFEYSLSEQLQMFCIYIEDQHRLAKEMQTNEKKFLTGMEKEVAKFEVDDVEGIKISESDRLESLIEIANTLFRFLYYKGEKSIENAVEFDHENISPYNIGSLEEIMYLSLQRNILVDIWGKFKYREWGLKVIEEDGIKYHIFVPSSEDDYKKERIAINRYIYRDHINVQKSNLKHLKENQKSARDLDNVSSALDLNDLHNIFKLEKKRFFQANTIIKNILAGQLESLDDIYYNLEHDGIKITDLFKGFEYLFTIAMIYQSTVLKKFDQDDISHYKKLSPIMDKVNFINQLSYLYNIENEVAEKIINILTFTNDPLLDVFSQPLIYVGKNKVIFCPTLILQMNIVRIIEMLVAKWGIDIANKGLVFEKQLRFILSFNPFIQVNTNKIEFKAYDGRDVEFDFIGLFEDHLLLIEFKHLQIPFSDRIKKNALGTIDFGIEQINRREDIIKHDWEKIKEECSFELPEEPPNKVIKLLCTNIFDFSTIICEGVEIIDSSSLLKFFMSPKIKGITIGSEINEALYKKLWKGDHPTVQEFKLFLQCPVAIKPFINCYERVFKPLMKIKDEDNNISFFDYILIKDPYENLNNEIFQSNTRNSKKIGRNEPCLCGSGKKYKKCCGVQK